jgi:hypothetical protein
MDRIRGRDACHNPYGFIGQKVFYQIKVTFDDLGFLRANYGTMAALHTDFIYDLSMSLNVVRAGIYTDGLERA